MKPGLLQYAAAWASLLPVVGLMLRARRGWSRGVRWTVLWCLLVAIQNLLARTLGTRGQNNLWISYVFLPVITTTALVALAQWQGPRARRLTVRWGVAGVIVVSIVLTLVLEDTRYFSLIVAPFHAVVLLLVSLWTFVRLGLDTAAAPYRSDWFWILAGLILHSATAAAVQPLGWFFLRVERLDLVLAVWSAASAAWIVTFLAITWGVVCPTRPTVSGGFSLQPSSRSPSSSPR